MRMSESLQKNVLDVGVGVLLNKLKGNLGEILFSLKIFLLNMLFCAKTEAMAMK